MIRLTFYGVVDGWYAFGDEEGTRHRLHLNFIKFEPNLIIGDEILFPKKLLDKNESEYSTHYNFGGLDEPSGRDPKTHPEGVIRICYQNGKQQLLKRCFG